MNIVRRPLRAQIREEILRRMAEGRYSAGESINEVEMATELGVSRTPLREALIGLEFEGQIESQVGRGFRFPIVNPERVIEAGPIVAVLENLALDLSDPADLAEIGHQLAELTEEHARLDSDLTEVIRLDSQWHDVLLSACPNRSLLTLIGGIKLGSLWIRLESENAEALRASWLEGHREVAAALIKGDTSAAKQHVSSNWTDGVAEIIGEAFVSEPEEQQ